MGRVDGGAQMRRRDTTSTLASELLVQVMGAGSTALVLGEFNILVHHHYGVHI